MSKMFNLSCKLKECFQSPFHNPMHVSIKLIVDFVSLIELIHLSVSKLSENNEVYQIFQDIVARVVFFTGPAEEDRQVLLVLDQELEDLLRHVLDRVRRLLLDQPLQQLVLVVQVLVVERGDLVLEVEDGGEGVNAVLLGLSGVAHLDEVDLKSEI